MARPPTQLTAMLRAAPDPAAMARALADSNSLARTIDPSVVTAIIDDVVAEIAARPPGWCGPDLADGVADRLAAAGLLSANGERRRVAPPGDTSVRGLRRFFARPRRD